MRFRGVLFSGCVMLGMALTTFAQAAEPKRGGTVVFGIPNDPSSLLRNVSSLPIDGTTGCIISQGLVEVDITGTPKPLLAKTIDIAPDGKTYTFTLQDAKWHDGKPLTSEDVRFTLMDISGKYSPIFQRALESIQAIETPSDKVVVIKLKQPYAPLLTSLACLQGSAIMPAHIYAGKDLKTNPASSMPIGTGPFKIKEWVRGSHIKFVKNPDYWEKGKPYIDELIAQVIPTAAGRAQALLAGQIDDIPSVGLDVSNYPLIQSNPSVSLVPVARPPGINWMFLNVEHKPFNDKRVRKALFMATDRDYIKDVAYGNAADPGVMPFPASLTWAADPSIDFRTMYPFDVARANALLDEAGFKRGSDGKRFSLTFLYRTNFSGGAETAAAVKSMWEKIGVDVKIVAAEAAASTQRVYIDGDFDVFYTSYNSQGDPALGIAKAFVSSAVGVANGNAARYSDPTVDKLFDKAVLMPTQKESGEVYKEIQRILADELPALSIVEQKNYDAQANYLKGMENNYHYATFREAWLDR